MLSASSRPLLGLFSGRRVRTETLCPPHRLVLCVISSIAIRSCGARVQCVFRQGDAATSVYLVTNGQLEVVIHCHPIMCRVQCAWIPWPMTRACVKQALRMCRSRASAPKGGREGSPERQQLNGACLLRVWLLGVCWGGAPTHCRNAGRTQRATRQTHAPAAAREPNRERRAYLGRACATERSGPCPLDHGYCPNCVVRAAAAPWVRLALVRRASVARIGVGSVRI